MIRYTTKILVDEKDNGIKFQLLKQEDIPTKSIIYENWKPVNKFETGDGIADLLSIALKLQNDPEAFIQNEDTEIIDQLNQM